MKTRRIPSITIPRLSMYYRVLLECRDADLISSEDIAKATGSTAAQVRKDLAYFGQFGAPGKGYEPDTLKRAIVKILGTDREWRVALVGVGNLGSALLSYKGFSKQGFKIVSAFDNDLRKIGKSPGGVTIKDISKLASDVKLKRIDMAIVTVPQGSAQEVVNKLVKTGVRAILNFAPTRPHASKGVSVLNIDLSIELERLAYFLTGSTRIKKL